jgi:hypothetical protein
MRRVFNSNMLTLALVGGLLLLCGCASTYVITLSNGARITTSGKPKYKNGCYYYTDQSGRRGYVPGGRVREVAPASMAEDESPNFKPKSSK